MRGRAALGSFAFASALERLDDLARFVPRHRIFSKIEIAARRHVRWCEATHGDVGPIDREEIVTLQIPNAARARSQSSLHVHDA